MKKNFNYYKNWAIKQLKKHLYKKIDNIDKSVFLNFTEVIKGNIANIGEIREWQGKKYKKIAQGKWMRYYEQTSKSSKIALENAIKEIENLKDCDFYGLLQIILKHKSRFSNNYSKPLPEVEEISHFAANKQSDWQKTNRHLKDNIDKILNGTEAEKKALEGKYFNIAETPQFLKDLGINGEQFTIKTGTITRKRNKNAAHKLTTDDWMAICDSITTPFAVCKNINKRNGYRLFLNIKIKDRYINIGIDVIVINNKTIINSIKSAYGRLNNNEAIIIYMDKKITPEQRTLLTGHLESADSARNINSVRGLKTENSDNRSIPQSNEKSIKKSWCFFTINKKTGETHFFIKKSAYDAYYNSKK